MNLDVAGGLECDAEFSEFLHYRLRFCYSGIRASCQALVLLNLTIYPENCIKLLVFIVWLKLLPPAKLSLCLRSAVCCSVLCASWAARQPGAGYSAQE